MILSLEANGEDGRTRKAVVEPGRSLKVGRSGETDLAFPGDMMMSRQHFAIESGAGGYRLRDLGSSNGTLLNGRKVVGPSPLGDGDCIQAGRASFRVHVESAEADRKAPGPSTSPPPASIARNGESPRGHAGMRSASRWTPMTAFPAVPPVAPADDRPATPPLPAEASPAPRRPEPSGDALPVGDAAELAGPFPVRTMMWEGLDGKARMTVILKCTLRMPAKHGVPATVADEQLPIFEADVPSEDDAIRSLRFEGDMVPYKPRADVVVVGAAYFPRHKDPATPLDVSVRVGRLEKTVRVFGDRSWSFPSRLALIPEIGKPAPYSRMEITYDRAFGGIDESAALYARSNLAGRGFAGKKTPDSLHGKPLPNIEDPSDPVRGWDSRPRPAGLGFYGRGWSPRLELAGTPSPTPEGRERTLGLPADFDYGFFNGAHPDLQVPGYLRGDEEVELRNLSADSDFEFLLPGLRPRIVVTRWETPPDEWLEASLAEGREASLEDVPTRRESLEPALDTLVLIPDEGLLYLVYRGQVPLRDLERLEIAGVEVSVRRPTAVRDKPSGLRTWIPRAET